MTTAVPVIPAVTTPDEDPIAVTDGFELVQLPPDVASESVMVLPGHSGTAPVIAGVAVSATVNNAVTVPQEVV